ncbi:hypothetical protein GDO81_027774 [Engystomops pustulosus]|uniref:Uncharacterized protein n=1 Tax=Engystomops pustulosus TaxID=76066 RepID=A0AAV6YI13_ENGPU|nr:hypothetical protein GDO81_027774 [Engystomops pustulosus]
MEDAKETKDNASEDQESGERSEEVEGHALLRREPDQAGEGSGAQDGGAMDGVTRHQGQVPPKQDVEEGDLAQQPQEDAQQVQEQQNLLPVEVQHQIFMGQF